MKISIIIPIYNSARTLCRCVDSILKNGYNDFEIILVNDGSTDNSLDICNSYSLQDTRIKVINKLNGGVSSARNLGIEHANGEWITFIDSDDWVGRNFLSCISYVSNDINLVLCNFSILGECEIQEKKYPPKIVRNQDFIDDLHKYILDDIMLGPWSKFFKKNIIQENNIRYDDKIKWGEDRLFVLNYLSYINSFMFSGCGTYMYVLPPKTSTMLKYHANLDMILELSNKIKEVTEKINAKKMFITYRSLWKQVEIISYLENNTNESKRKSFYKGGISIDNIIMVKKKWGIKTVPIYILCNLLPRPYEYKIVQHFLNI